MSYPTHSFSGHVNLYCNSMLPKIQENEKVPLAFVLKENAAGELGYGYEEVLFLNGYYTVRNGQQLFVGIYQETKFTYPNDFAVANIESTETVFTFDDVIGWSLLSDIGIGY